MSLEFKALGLRNFLSFGSKEEIISLGGNHITVILGENRDTGGEDSKNGVGKSSLIDALCFVLFGKVIRGISNQKLISKLSTKGQMTVWVEFNKGQWAYRVERTERPGKLFLFRKPIDSNEAFDAMENRKRKFDIARGKNETTEQIIEILGFDITLFEYLVANSSESTEFFRLSEDKQRGIIEPLFGFTIMSEKAKLLKEDRKEKSKNLIEVESATEATKQANARILTEIEDLKSRAKKWEKQRAETITELKETISALEAVDTEIEIETIKSMAELQSKLQEASSTIRELESSHRDLLNTKKSHEDTAERAANEISEAERILESLANSECPTCKQHWEADSSVREEAEATRNEAMTVGSTALENFEQTENQINEHAPLVEAAKTTKKALEDELSEYQSVELVYETVEEAASAGATLDALREQLKNEDSETNPHLESIDGLRKKAIKEIDESEVQSIRRLIKHYDYLINLLTKRDSFLRQIIIDRWLPILNRRITYWLDILDLPHQVEFLPDLTVKITNYHEEFDYGNLSRGERTRVRVALNFAFQDVFEYMNYSINLLAVDELIDSGICPRGAENAVSALKETCSTKDKRVLLITHRDDVAARVDDVMTIIKENNITRIQHS